MHLWPIGNRSNLRSRIGTVGVASGCTDPGPRRAIVAYPMRSTGASLHQDAATRIYTELARQWR